MQKILLAVVFVCLACAQNSFAGKCSDIGDVFPNVRETNFITVPATKYPAVKAKMENKDCPQPKMIRIPNSAILIDELLLKNKKVKLWVVGWKRDHAGILEARWQSLFLSLFNDNSNFSLVERARLEDLLWEQAKGQTGMISSGDSAKAMKLFGATHMLIVDGQRSQSGLFKMDYYTGRLVDLETGKVMTVDEMED